MAKTRKEYLRNRDRILNSQLSETEKSNRLFANWQDYVFNSIPEEIKQQNLHKHYEEMILVRV